MVQLRNWNVCSAISSQRDREGKGFLYKEFKLSLFWREVLTRPSSHICGLCLSGGLCLGHFPATPGSPRVSDLPFLATGMQKAPHLPGVWLYPGLEGVYPMSRASMMLSAVSPSHLLPCGSSAREGMPQSFPCLISLGLF